MPDGSVFSYRVFQTFKTLPAFSRESIRALRYHTGVGFGDLSAVLQQRCMEREQLAACADSATMSLHRRVPVA